jgi:nucleolar protein 56
MDLRELNLKLTKESLKKNIPRDVLVIQTIHTIDELIKIINTLVANLRERYGYYAPRAARTEEVNQLLESVFEKNREDISLELNKEDLDSMIELANEIKSLISLKDEQEIYLENLTQEICPHTKEVATSLIAARLVDHAGSLKHLAELPSSTIQVLGAEKALFRHIKTGSRAPKFGIIFAHESITKGQQDNKGKIARKLASEISKAAKIDYFRKR